MYASFCIYAYSITYYMNFFTALTLGFKNAFQYHNDSKMTESLRLPLGINNTGSTDINITLGFSVIHEGTTATVGEGRFHFC